MLCNSSKKRVKLQNSVTMVTLMLTPTLRLFLLNCSQKRFAEAYFGGHSLSFSTFKNWAAPEGSLVKKGLVFSSIIPVVCHSPLQIKL